VLPVFFLPLWYLGLGAALVLGLGVVAGIFPALSAMRMPIAVALRRQA
jgi:ABC-type antimicrobial peptide transport system permease subunit